MSTSVGRKARPNFLHRTTPLIRIKPKDLSDAGIERVPRVVGVRNGLPLLEDNRTLKVRNVIWCTGYDSGFSWIDLPVFDDVGDPLHDRGVVSTAAGLYFIGLQFLYSMTSATVSGVGRDAKHIVKAIASRTQFGARKRPGVWTLRRRPRRVLAQCMQSSGGLMVDSALENLVLDLLDWLARRERTYEDVMNAWRTSCPKLPVWEEASDRGLLTREVRNGSSIVRITPQGTELLRQRRPSRRLEHSTEKVI